MELLCSYCEVNANDPSSIGRIPDVIHQLKSALNSQKIKKQHCLAQIQHVDDFLKTELEKAKAQNIQRIDDYFNSIQNSLNAAKIECKRTFEAEFKQYSESTTGYSDSFKETTRRIRKDICISEYLVDETSYGKINDY
jgi:hypothetical protein